MKTIRNAFLILFTCVFVANAANAATPFTNAVTYCHDSSNTIHLEINRKNNLIIVNGNNTHAIAEISNSEKAVTSEPYINSMGIYTYLIIYSTPNGVFMDFRNPATNAPQQEGGKLYCHKDI